MLIAIGLLRQTARDGFSGIIALTKSSGFRPVEHITDALRTRRAVSGFVNQIGDSAFNKSGVSIMSTDSSPKTGNAYSCKVLILLC